MSGGLLVLFLAAAAGPPSGGDAYTFPPQKRGDVTATLSVSVANLDDPLRSGAVVYSVAVEGPAGLEVEEPKLVDAGTTWKEERLPPEWVRAGGRASCYHVLQLKQTKAGSPSLPSVTVRFRESPSAAWEEVQWTNLLQGPQLHLSPDGDRDKVAEPRGWLLYVGISGAAALVLAVAGWFLARSLRQPPKPMSPRELAARELMALEANPVPELAFQVATVVRGFLIAELGLPPRERTTNEFLAAVREANRLPEETQSRLEGLLRRSDELTFAGLKASDDEGRRLLAEARAVVDATPLPAPEPAST